MSLTNVFVHVLDLLSQHLVLLLQQSILFRAFCVFLEISFFTVKKPYINRLAEESEIL